MPGAAPYADVTRSRAAVEAAPERLLWGSTGRTRSSSRVPNDGDLFDLSRTGCGRGHAKALLATIRRGSTIGTGRTPCKKYSRRARRNRRAASDAGLAQAFPSQRSARGAFAAGGMWTYRARGGDRDERDARPDGRGGEPRRAGGMIGAAFVMSSSPTATRSDGVQQHAQRRAQSAEELAL